MVKKNKKESIVKIYDYNNKLIKAKEITNEDFQSPYFINKLFGYLSTKTVSKIELEIKKVKT